MRKRSLYIRNQESVNIFQSFSDLMSNAFMILCLFLILALFQSQKLNRHLKEANKRLQSASPIVIDEQSGKFKFKSGSAELNLELKKYIQTQIIPAIEATIANKEIEFIQVIGHTDGQGIEQNSNLDKTLEKVAQGTTSVTKLFPGSNADLGLMRALAVVQEIQKTKAMNNIEFRAYSAAQLYLPSGKLAPIDRNADETRRRIEIRFIPPGKTK